MMKSTRPLLLTVVLLSAASPAIAATDFFDDWYVSAKIARSYDTLSSANLTSPRVTDRIAGPNTSQKTSASFAFGKDLPGNWRYETEFTTPVRSEYKTRWREFPNNVNNMKISSERYMLNVYKDFPLNQSFSLYGMAGLGFSRISADGWQGTEARAFERKQQTNFAYRAPRITGDFGLMAKK